MPIYEYRCAACGTEKEHFQKRDDPPPQCEQEGCARKGEPMERKVSKVNFELKGGGWARDGYGG
jgi:putative FmdB family regulatory protein